MGVTFYKFEHVVKMMIMMVFTAWSGW